MPNFTFREKGLGLVSPPHFEYEISRKMFLMLYSIKWPNFIVWSPLLPNILGNMCITTVCSQSCDAIKFEINLIFLIRLFWYMTKKSTQIFKYLENKKSFWGEIKSIFHRFQTIFDCQRLSKTSECAFKSLILSLISCFVVGCIKKEFSFGFFYLLQLSLLFVNR